MVADAPPGRYTALDGTDGYVCAVTEDGELACWGRFRKQDGARPDLEDRESSPYSPYGPMHDPPHGNYMAVMVTVSSFLDTAVLTACAERVGGGWVCWQSRGVYWFVGDEEERTWEVEGDPLDSAWVVGITDPDMLGDFRVMATPDPSPGRFTQISSRWDYACALTEAGAPVCWESVRNVLPPLDPPPGRYVAVSDGRNHTCALTEAGQAVRWGWNNWGQSEAPPGRYTAITAGDFNTCALTESGEEVCWGDFSSSPLPTGHETCALTDTGEAVCGGVDAPLGQYTALAVGWQHACALDEAGEAVCWAWAASRNKDEDPYGNPYRDELIEPPPGPFIAISASEFRSCAVTEAGEVFCWGDVSYSMSPLWRSLM